MSAGPRSRFARWCGYAARGAALLGLTLVVLLGAGVGYLSTRAGKAALIERVEDLLDEALPGRIDIGELVELGLGGVVLHDVRVTAPAGNTVLSVARLSATLDLAALGKRSIRLHGAELEDVFVELRLLADGSVGLVSAFVALDEPDVPETGPDTPPPGVSIEGARLKRVRAMLPETAALGALELRDTELQANVRVGAALEIDVRDAHAGLFRSEQALGELWLNGTAQLGQASRVELRSSVCGATLTLTAHSPALQFSGFTSVPLDADLDLGGWSPRELGCLLGEGLAANLPPGPSNAALQARGTLEHWVVSGRLAGEAGALQLGGVLHLPNAIELRLEAPALRLRSLHASLPDVRLSTALDVSLAELGGAAPRLRAQADSELAGVPLPRLRLSTRLAGTALHELELQLTDGPSSLDIEGSVSFDGAARLQAGGQVDLGSWSARARSLAPGAPEIGGRLALDLGLSRDVAGRLDVSGNFSSETLRVGDASLPRVTGQLAANGRWPAPAVHLDLRFGDEARPAAAFGRLQLVGAAPRYGIDARGQLPEWGTLALRGSLELFGQGARVALSGTGTTRGAPWRVDVPRGELFDDGRLSFPDARVSLAGQAARLSVVRSFAGWAGEVRFDGIDLARLLTPFGLAAAPRGRASGQLVLHGPTARPLLGVDVKGQGLGLASGPAFDAQLHGSIDIGASSAELAAQLDEAGNKPRLRLALQAKAALAATGSWSRRWLQGTQHVSIDVARLEASLIDELLGEPQPFAFDLTGDAALTLERGRPGLQLHTRGTLSERRLVTAGTSPQPADRLELGLALDGPHVDVQLSLADRTKTWLGGSARFALADAEASVRALAASPAAALQHLVETTTWQARLALEPRPLELLPLVALPVELRKTRLQARLEARREPGRAASGQLELELRGSGRAASSDCSLPGLVTRLLVRLDADRFDAELSAIDSKRTLLRAAAHGQLDLAPLLAGGSVGLEELVASADTERLELGELPVWCGRVQGSVTSSTRLHIARGTPPALTARLGLEGFSVGGEDGVDVTSSLDIGPTELHARGSIGASARPSTFELKLPLTSRGGALSVARDAPVQAQLSLVALDVAPFLAEFAALSHARGTLDGGVTLAGSLDEPRLSGELRLADGAVTSNAFAQSLTEIEADIAFSESSIAIKRLIAHDGSGSLSADGKFTGLRTGSFDAAIDVVAQKFPLRQAGQVVATTSASARVQAAWRPERRDIELRLRQVDTWLESSKAKEELSLTPHPDLEVDDVADALARQERRRERRSAPAPGKPRPPLTLRIDAGQQFWVKRADFGVKLTAALQIVDAGGTAPADTGPAVSGDIGFDRGYVALLGRNFVVKPGGTLRFAAGSSPVVDLTAIYEDRRSDDVLEVHVSGSADAPKLDFTINGARVTPAEAMRAIYGNTDTDATTEDPNNAEVETKQFLGALTAGVLNTSIRRTLGDMAPIVTLSPTDQQGGSELRAGFELDSLIPDFLRDIVTGVYVEGIFSSDATSEQYGRRELQPGVLMELFFPYNLVTSGRYGPDSTWSLDFGWHP